MTSRRCCSTSCAPCWRSRACAHTDGEDRAAGRRARRCGRHRRSSRRRTPRRPARRPRPADRVLHALRHAVARPPRRTPPRSTWPNGPRRAGCFMVGLSEHHASPDGYLPSPLVLAAAMAARTQQVSIMVAAALLPFYDPIRLAEDMSVLDHVSGGRVSYVLGLGYRPEEFALYRVPMRERARRADEHLRILLDALAGTAFPSEAGDVRVTPAPMTPGGPSIAWGGQSVAAARRAARFGLGFYAQTDGDELAAAYRDECAAQGREPGPCILPSPERPGDDVRRRRCRPRVVGARSVPPPRRGHVRRVERQRAHREPFVREDGGRVAGRSRRAPGRFSRRCSRAHPQRRVPAAASVVRRPPTRARVAVSRARRRRRAPAPRVEARGIRPGCRARLGAGPRTRRPDR